MFDKHCQNLVMEYLLWALQQDEQASGSDVFWVWCIFGDVYGFFDGFLYFFLSAWFIFEYHNCILITLENIY